MGWKALWCLLILSFCGAVVATISDLRLCGDPECKEPVSKGVTVLGYPSNDKDILSFPNNAQVLIYSKEAGSRRDLWGVEIKGKRGYAPLKYIREHKVFKPKPAFEVPTEPFFEKRGSGKHNFSEKSLSEGVKEKKAEEAFSQNIDVAITAEDVEYNGLQPLVTTEEPLASKEASTQTLLSSTNTHPEQATSQASSNAGDKIEEDIREEEEEEEDNEDQNQEIEEEKIDGQREEDEHNVDEKITADGNKLKEETEPSATDSQKEDHEKEDDDPTGNEESTKSSVLVDPSEPVLQSEPEPPLPQMPSETNKEEEDSTEASIPVTVEPTSVTLEPSSVSFEVIDGTTVCLEDVTTATTTPQETHSPAQSQASYVIGEAAVTMPIPALLHHLPPVSTVSQPEEQPTETPHVGNSKALNAEIKPSHVPDHVHTSDKETLNEEPVTEEDISQDVEIPPTPVDSETTTMAYFYEEDEENESAEEEMASKYEEIILETEKSKDDSLLSVGADTEEDRINTQDSEDFIEPKPETIIESPETQTEEPVESQGFFASLFGSSETTDTPEAEESSEVLESSTSEAVSEGYPLDVETMPSEDSRADGGDDTEAAFVEYSANVDPPDSNAVPVDENESHHIVAQAAEDVDQSAPNSYHSNLSSVDINSSASPSLEQSHEVPLPVRDSPTDLVSDTSDMGESSEEETVGNIDGGEEELGHSTARPMYAEPEPTTQSYTDPNVDPDELAHLAGTGEKSVDENTLENLVEDSLTEKFLKTSHNLLPEGLAFGVEAEMADPEMSQGVMVFLGIVVFTIIAIYVVHLFMLKISRESPILEALNSVDRDMRMLANENTSLHEDLCKARTQLEDMKSHVTESSGDLSELDTQLELIKAEHANETAQQEEKIVQLERELEEATSNSLEMHKMLSEMLSAQKDASTFQASVDHLQAMLDGQREKVENLNSDLALKTRLNEELHIELSASREQVGKLDSQVQQLTHSLKELSSSKEDTSQRLTKEIELVRELQDINKSLTEQSGDHDTRMSSLTQELHTLQDTILTLRECVETKDSELKVAKECLKQFRLTSEDDHAKPDDEKLSSLFDVIRIKAELQRVNDERNNLVEQLRDSEMAQKNLEDTMSSIRSEVTELRTVHDEAVQEKQEALSKLAVLTQYFEEKEAQLTKELESQEGLRLNAEGTAAAVAHKIQKYELEAASYKTQVESLRKELHEQESSYKTQISSYEQKAHDNWLQARAAERKHEEQRQENSQLRNRLTLLQKEREELQVGILKPTPKRLDANGRMPSPLEGEVDVDPSESPPHPPPSILPMMLPPGAPLPPGMPPPPRGFHGVPPPPPHGLPPGVPPFLHGELPFMRPPLPPLPGDRRLPPAGGMSSPPFRRSGSPTYNHRNDRYSPSSEHSHLSDRHYSPPPLRHRPPSSPDLHRHNHSPGRRSDRMRSPDRRLDRMRASPDHRLNRRTPDRRLDRRSPDRHFSTRSPDGYHRHRSSPHDYYDHSDYNSDDSRLHQAPSKGKKTSTPLGPTDRWKNDV